MPLLTGALKTDEIDDWFKIGTEAAASSSSVKAIATSTLGGRVFNPVTGRAVSEEDRQNVARARIPRYIRNREQHAKQQYVEEYKQQEYDELMSNASHALSGRESPQTVSDIMDRLELNSTIAGGSVAMPEDLIPEGATDVYKNYKFEHKYTDLPVLEAREKILRTIESNQVTILQGPTGTGKTTQVPQFILDHYKEESQYCNIVVTQPRKIAAISVAQRVCDERRWNLGGLCGYQVGLDPKVSEDTRILYCTTGVLKEKLINKKNMHEFTHVILDEVHERDIESDFALLIVKKLLHSNSSHVKVILMSATFDTESFAKYFSLPVGNKLETAPVVSVGVSQHRVLEYFADDLTSRLGEIPTFDESKPGIGDDMYNMAVGLIQEFDLLEEKELGKDERTNFAPVRGSVLVFLPGLGEITNMCNRLRPLEDTHFLWPVPLHSSITITEQKKVFRAPNTGYRKVILSTNIAESSITVPDIKYVIDFCLTKNLCCDSETNYTHLQLEWASKANTIQRKGRAGRVSNGRVYYMVPRWFYDSVLQEYGVPEMQRSPLESLILKTKIFDMGEPKAILALALSPPDLGNIERTILSLKEAGALSLSVGESSNPFDGDLTFVGRVMAGLPLDIRISKLIIFGHIFGLLEECIIIGAALSVKSIFAQPLQARLQAFKTKCSWSDSSMSDLIAILNAYKVWDTRTKTHEFRRTGENERDWGLKSYIQIKTMHEVHKLVVELEQRLSFYNILVPQHKQDFKRNHTDASERLFLKFAICGAFYPHYAIKEETDEMDAVKTLSNNDPLRTVMVKGLPMNQGILYEQQIRKIFSTCWKDPPPVISFEDTRAFVEFLWKPGQRPEGQVHPAVLFAIKMRDLRIPMQLDLLDKDEAKSRMETVERVAMSRRMAGDLRTNRLKAEGDVYQDSMSQQNDIGIDPQISLLLISITEVIECGHFWGQCDDDRNYRILTGIQEMLNNPQKPLQDLKTRPTMGMIVAAPYQDVKEDYYRGRIEELRTDQIRTAKGIPKSILKAKIFFVDFGNSEEIEIDRLKVVPSEAQDAPFLAVEFYLKGICPACSSGGDGKWTREATAMFTNIVLNKKLFAEVYSVIKNTVRVELVEKSANGQERSVNEFLVNKKFADKCEEPFLSQQNHEWREGLKRGDAVSAQPDSWLQINMASQGSDVRRSNKRFKKQSLKGPINPMEMSFMSMTCGGRQKPVKVSPDSINSVAIDENPQNKFNRLIVAANIGLTASTSVLIAHDTTVMPQIPGLPAIVTLIFTPYAEFRTNVKRQRYTGALCGLGYDEDDLPILPDHDIELIFETSFDSTDVEMINDLRRAVNTALCTDGDTFPWGIDHTINEQERARKLLKTILTRSRDTVQQEAFMRQYYWNQIDPDYLVNSDESDREDTLLRLHSNVLLTEEQPMVEALRWKDYYLQHIEDLTAFVQSHQRCPVTCELCHVTMPTSQMMALHMETERHIRKVESVHNGTFRPR